MRDNTGLGWRLLVAAIWMLFVLNVISQMARL